MAMSNEFAMTAATIGVNIRGGSATARSEKN